MIMPNALMNLFAFLPLIIFAQQKPVSNLPFCGIYPTSLEKLKENRGKQFDFYKVAENDTIVDIGASSGSIPGAFSALSPLQNLTFILVDIDRNCLNEAMVQNMKEHYEKVKGSPITNKFKIVNNTPDSLWLAPDSYSKAWLLNTLHELPNPQKMVKDIHAILRNGGELMLLEIMSRKAGHLHGGCKMPLWSEDALRKLFTTNGFTIQDRQLIVQSKKSHVLLLRLKKN